jgi:hypothetical protein
VSGAHFVADLVPADAGTGPFHDPGEVPTERDGELVLEHLLQRARSDEDVGRIDRRRVDADEQLLVAGLGLRNVVSQRGLGVKAFEGERSHLVALHRMRSGEAERPRFRGLSLGRCGSSYGLACAT